MEKVTLKPKEKIKSNTSSSPFIVQTAHNSKMISMNYNGEDIYSFSLDIDRVEKMIAWLYDNTTERFTLLGTENIYFESSEDAMAFKLRWT